jgi:hypothetical protein
MAAALGMIAGIAHTFYAGRGGYGSWFCEPVSVFANDCLIYPRGAQFIASLLWGFVYAGIATALVSIIRLTRA